MNRKTLGLLCLSFALAGPALSPAEEAPAPGASSYLAGTAESFLASCRSDLEDAKKRIAVLKAAPGCDGHTAGLRYRHPGRGGRTQPRRIGRAGASLQAFSRCRPGG